MGQRVTNRHFATRRVLAILVIAGVIGVVVFCLNAIFRADTTVIVDPGLSKLHVPLASPSTVVQASANETRADNRTVRSSSQAAEMNHEVSTAEDISWLGHPQNDEATSETLNEYRDALICRDYLHTIIVAEAMSKKESNDDGTPPAVLALTLEGLERAKAMLEQNRDRCSGVEQKELDRKMFELSLQLGLKGYLPAQACFVEGPFLELSDYLHGNEGGQRLYLNNAPHFMLNLLAIGDYPTILGALHILGPSYGHGGKGPEWLEMLGMPDPYLVYRAVRIIYYRVMPSNRESTERLLHQLESRYQFSSAKIAEADTWARQVYAERYANVPPLDVTAPQSGCREALIAPDPD